MTYLPEYKELQRKIGFIGKSERLKPVLQLIDTISDTDITVLIHGESGTGKEIVAAGIHLLSKRSEEHTSELQSR